MRPECRRKAAEVTGETKNCWGCAWRTTRIRGSRRMVWCSKYHLAHDVRCIDYSYKQSAIDKAICFFARIGRK